MTDNKTKGCLAFVGIVIATIWGTVNLTSFLGTLIIGLIIYVFYIISKIKRQKTKLEEFNKKKGKLISTDNYRYIKNFVTKFKSVNYDNEEVNKLKDLIFEKGIVFDDRELGWLIAEETNKQNYEEFSTRILYNKPDTLEQYIKNFIEIYDEDYQKHLEFFKDLLRYDKIYFNEEQIIKEIEKTKKDMDLKYFEKRLESENFRSITIQDIDLITGHEFEQFLKTLFEKMGYKVELTKLTGDQGADLIISKFGEKVAVQAKRYSQKVNNKAIQEVVATIKHYSVDRGIVITNSEFTRFSY